MSSHASVDVHQHLWPETFGAALTWRREPPLLRRGGRGWLLRLRDEPESAFHQHAHDPDARLRLLQRDGVDQSLLAISSPLGIEALPRDEAEPLLEAHNSGLLELGRPFGVRGAVSLRPPAAGDVDALLDAGAVGISLPAGAVAGGPGLDRCADLLARLEARDAPLLVHPGPGPWRAWRPQAYAEPGAPVWWPAMTRYVADMNAAWHAFVAFGRPRHPRLRVVFAMLAGGAPLHVERLGARGGPTVAVADSRLFYDTSEERLALGGPPLRRRIRAGEAIDFAASDIHRVAHGGDGPAITINAYSPPLWRMGAYETTLTGELQRHSISYAEELRPLSLAAQ